MTPRHGSGPVAGPDGSRQAPVAYSHEALEACCRAVKQWAPWAPPLPSQAGVPNNNLGWAGPCSRRRLIRHHLGSYLSTNQPRLFGLCKETRRIAASILSPATNDQVRSHAQCNGVDAPHAGRRGAPSQAGMHRHDSLCHACAAGHSRRYCKLLPHGRKAGTRLQRLEELEQDEHATDAYGGIRDALGGLG